MFGLMTVKRHEHEMAAKEQLIEKLFSECRMHQRNLADMGRELSEALNAKHLVTQELAPLAAARAKQLANLSQNKRKALPDTGTVHQYAPPAPDADYGAPIITSTVIDTPSIAVPDSFSGGGGSFGGGGADSSWSSSGDSSSSSDSSSSCSSDGGSSGGCD